MLRLLQLVFAVILLSIMIRRTSALAADRIKVAILGVSVVM